VVAFVDVPLLIDGLGDTRFGLLAIAWVIVGYAGLLDLGLGRALTALASDRIGTGRPSEVPALFWTALAFMTATGTAGALALAAASPWLVGDVLEVDGRLHDEAVLSFYFLSAGIPFAIANLACKAMLQTYQRAGVITAIQVPLSILSYAGPLVVLGFTDSLPAVVAVVVASRIAGFLITFAMTLRLAPATRSEVAVRRSAAGHLIRFGGWVTVSNLIVPVMQEFDRFFVGVLLSATAVTYYAAPSEAVKKLWLISFSIVSVLYPAFALNRTRDPKRAAMLFGVGNRSIFAAMFPLVLVCVTLAPEILTGWLGGDFADRSEHVFQWLAVGVLVTALTEVPYSFVLSGRPDLVAKAELIELPIYLTYFWLLATGFGLEGAAVAWTLRQITGGAVAYGLAFYLSPLTLPTARLIGVATVAAFAVLLAAAQLEGSAARLAFLAFAVPGFLALAWLTLANSEERALLRARLRRLPAQAPSGERLG